MSSAPNPYLKTKILTASPAELRLMLLEGAIRFSTQARQGLEQRDHEAAYIGFSRSQAIILELLSALDKSKAPELCDRLSGLYTFMFNRLVEASSQKDATIVDEVIKLLEYERETWALAMSRLSAEEMGDSAGAEAPGRMSVPA